MKPIHSFILVATAAICAAPLAAQQVPAPIAAAVASPDRPAADKERDAARKPAELMVFAGVKAGDKVADFMPGGGYVTRLFSKIVGESGKVYALVPGEIAERVPRVVEASKAIAADPKFANVTVATPSGGIMLPEPIDLFWTSENYHDVYNGSGPEAASQLVTGVFKALKPGGVFIVTDHAAKPGTSQADATPLHRIDPALVKAQAQAAGFVLEGESTVIANPADPHDKPVFDASIRGKTDQFALKFRKPR